MVTMELFEKFYTGLVKFDSYLGMELKVHQPGKITYSLRIKEHHLTSPDQTHGGVISAMMDAVLGVTALSWAASKDNLCSTVEFKINYISTAKPGELLEGTADIDYAGNRMITATGSICEKTTGRLIAKGMGTFAQYPMSKKKEIIDSRFGELKI